MSFIVPAVLPSSREELEKTLARFAGMDGVGRVQVDVVDGKFASPASWPYNAPGALAPLVRAGWTLPHLDRITYEMDLMCYDAAEAAETWLHFGATRFTFHAGSMPHMERTIAHIRELDASSGRIAIGVALHVETPNALIEPYLSAIDYVQFMGIAKIGVQGQPFDERALRNVRTFHEKHPDVPMQVDGGIRLAAAEKLVPLGVANLIVGSGILRAPDPEAAVAALNALAM